MLLRVLCILFACLPLLFSRETLFLTWVKDPTSEVLVQWLESGDSEPVHYTKLFTIPRGDKAEGGRATVALLPVEHYYEAQENNAHLSLWMGGERLQMEIQVEQPTVKGSDDLQSPWLGDSVEIFLAESVGADSFQQYIFSPPQSEQFEPVHVNSYPKGAFDEDAIALKAEGRLTDRGYVMRLSFKVDPQAIDIANKPFALQAVIKNFANKHPALLTWNPSHRTYQNSKYMIPVQVGDEASVQRANVQLVSGGEAGLQMRVRLADEVAGEWTVYGDGQSLLSFEAEAKRGWATGAFSLDVSELRVNTLELAKAEGSARQFVQLPTFVRQKPPKAETVYWRAEGAQDWKRAEAKFLPFGAEGMYIQKLKIDGLSADSLYDLRVGESTEVFSFRTAPRKIVKPLVFAEGGDVGTSEHVPVLFEIASEWDPLFGLVGGDIAYANGISESRWIKFLSYWNQYMRAEGNRLIPMVVCIGNHEVVGGFNGTREKASLYYALFEDLYPEEGYAAMDIGEDLSLILLDSGHTTRIKGEQTDWLERVLSERQAKPFLFPLYHVPAYPAYRDFSTKRGSNARGGYAQRKYWSPLFEAHGIPLVFEHDDHAYKRTYPMKAEKIVQEGGVVYVGDGAWGKGNRNPLNKPRDYYNALVLGMRHVIKMTLYPDGTFQGQAYNLANEEFDRFEGDGRM